MSYSSCGCTFFFLAPLSNVFPTVSPYDPDNDQTLIHMLPIKGPVDAHKAYHVDRHIGT